MKIDVLRMFGSGGAPEPPPGPEMAGLSLKPVASDGCIHTHHQAYKHSLESGGFNIRCWCLDCKKDVRYLGTIGGDPTC